MTTLRTFIAVETPPDVQSRAAALIERLRTAGAKVRWTAPRQMHWTLNFLGDVEDRDIPDICKAAMQAAESLSAFDLEVCGVGAFPTLDRPRTLWLGAGNGADAMIALQAALEQSLANLGFRPENRRYRPHLTLGRVREMSAAVTSLAELMRTHADFFAGTAYVSEVTIFASTLGRDGPLHEPLGHAELREVQSA